MADHGLALGPADGGIGPTFNVADTLGHHHAAPSPTYHRKFCGECGCHMCLHVDAFPVFELVHLPTLDRGVDPGGEHPMVAIPDDGLPRHPGWAGTARHG